MHKSVDNRTMFFGWVTSIFVKHDDRRAATGIPDETTALMTTVGQPDATGDRGALREPGTENRKRKAQEYQVMNSFKLCALAIPATLAGSNLHAPRSQSPQTWLHVDHERSDRCARG